MTDKTEHGITTRLTALLGLAASKTMTSESCPSDQQLADFIQGQLKHKVQQRVLSHLNSCPDCRQTWLDTAAYMDTVAVEQSAELAQKSPLSGFSSVRQLFANRLNPWPLATVSLASAAILLTLLWSGSPTLEQRINTGYDTLAMTDQSALKQAVRAFSMPWNQAVMGFSQTGSDPQTRAFGAGLWAGKNAILTTATEPLPEPLAAAPNQPWQSSQWANFYQLGRELFLLWVETQSETGQANWTQHTETLQQLTSQFEGEIADSLRAIETQLQSLIVSQNPIREQNQLRRLLETTMQQYAPN